MAHSAVDSVIASAIENRAFPGAVYAIQNRIAAQGSLTYDLSAPPACEDTIWDLASLTKVVVTTTLAMFAYERGLLDLETPLREVLPAFRHESVTFRHLLHHNSGLPPSHPCPSRIADRAQLLRDALTIELTAVPGSETVYSDLGFIALGQAIEALMGKPLNVLFRKLVTIPLRMRETVFNPTLGFAARCAPTEAVEPWRTRLRRDRRQPFIEGPWIQGEVHDPTAAVLGGVAGHAGVFSTAGDLVRFMAALTNGSLVSPQTLATFTTRSSRSSRALGWDTPSPGSSAGNRFGPRSFGHTGFTGTSIWHDPDRGITVILLTNRVHPTSENDQIRAVRIAFNDAAWESLP